MNNPHPAIARALAAELEREQLAQVAIGLGFDPGVAPQIAAQALEASRATSLEPRQYIEMMSRLVAAESAGSGYDALAKWRGTGRHPGPLSVAWTACRHAVKFARRVLLHK